MSVELVRQVVKDHLALGFEALFLDKTAKVLIGMIGEEKFHCNELGTHKGEV